MKRLLFMMVGLTFVFSSAFLMAQAPRREPMGKVRENINRLRLLRMTEALDLTEDQTAKIYPVSTRIEKNKMDIIRDLNQQMGKLRALLKEDEPDEAALATAVKTVRELRAELLAQDKEFEDFLDAQLTEIQRAKYLIFAAEFYRNLGEQLGRARAWTREKRQF
jgi:Spy/CpxP family protein refolding chaperone